MCAQSQSNNQLHRSTTCVHICMYNTRTHKHTNTPRDRERRRTEQKKRERKGGGTQHKETDDTGFCWFSANTRNGSRVSYAKNLFKFVKVLKNTSCILQRDRSNGVMAVTSCGLTISSLCDEVTIRVRTRATITGENDRRQPSHLTQDVLEGYHFCCDTLQTLHLLSIEIFQLKARQDAVSIDVQHLEPVVQGNTGALVLLRNAKPCFCVNQGEREREERERERERGNTPMD